MIYTIEKEKHNAKDMLALLAANPEIKFVSLVGLDIFGHDTDEKIPVHEMTKDYDAFMARGAQTDGSSVLLPKIADISNARVDIIPDPDCNWYVDYNEGCGTLRIPAILVHNIDNEIGSRAILRDSLKVFKEGLVKAIKDHPYVLEYLPIKKADEIKEIVLTSATEIEFYVMTPHDQADRERLHTSQQMKEQYWKRTIGPVRTALEDTLIELDKYGIGVEMGHKEVGGVNAQLVSGGSFDHIMEQLEVDFRYSDPMQAADNDYLVRNVIKDVFRKHGLDVTFMAKPVPGVAGSGKHTHFGVCAKLKNGKTVNLFSPVDMKKDFMSPIGYGALMGLLKNYEIVSPFVSATTDAFNRLKPGYEAPVCPVTSLGVSVESPSRNRTIMAGLIRDAKNTMATRFELRSPNPKSNTYLVLAAGHIAMLDGILAALKAEKTPAELEKSVSKKFGSKDFYLEKDRVYRAESNIFEDYTPEEREKLFGKSPRTVWEALNLFDDNKEKTKLLFKDGVMDELDLESFKAATLRIWETELSDRLIEDWREKCKDAYKLHYKEDGSTDLDEMRWKKIDTLRRSIAQDSSKKKSMLTKLEKALADKNYSLASKMQLEISDKVLELENLYNEYKRNLF